MILKVLKYTIFLTDPKYKFDSMIYLENWDSVKWMFKINKKLKFIALKWNWVVKMAVVLLDKFVNHDI